MHAAKKLYTITMMVPRVVRPKQQPTAEQIEAYWLEVIVDYGMD